MDWRSGRLLSTPYCITHTPSERDLDSIDQCVMCGIQVKTKNCVVGENERKIENREAPLEDENLYSKCYYMYLSTIFIFIFTHIVVVRVHV